MRDLRVVAAATLLTSLAFVSPAHADVQPAAPQPVAAVLDGTQAVLRWRNVDPLAVRVVIRRLEGPDAPASALDGTPVYDGPPLPVGDLQLDTDAVDIGVTYSYGFWSFDAAGAVSAETTHSLRAIAPPVVVAPAIVSNAGTGTTFTLAWANPANPPGTPYDVKYWTPAGWVVWVQDTRIDRVVIGSPAGPFPTVAGATYRFEVLSQDPYGNDSRHGLATVVEPLDTSAATASKGWRTVASTRRWAGTVALASKPGATMTWHVTGSQVTVVADRCPGCGKARVLVDGTVRAVADTHATSLSVRQQVATVGHLTPGRHVVSVQVVGSTGHPAVQLDALAVLN